MKPHKLVITIKVPTTIQNYYAILKKYRSKKVDTTVAATNGYKETR